MILLDAQGLAASRPNRPLFADVSLTLNDGDRIGVVGLNGSGKTTLLRILADDLAPEAGVVRRGRGARIGVLPQLPVLPTGTVRDSVGEGWRGEAMLDQLGMTPLLDAPTDQLSGGQQKRTALAHLLVREWDALILDEPTNHLDLDAIAALEDWLAAFTGGLLLVTHDRHVLDRVTTKVLEIDRGRAYLHTPLNRHAGSGYAAYLAARVEREERAVVDEQARRNLARHELAWLRRGAPARSTKPKARVAAARAVIADRPQAAARAGELDLGLGSQRLGSKGIELHGVAFAWPGGVTVLAPFDHALEPGDRLGIVGPNGAGKSTLLDLVAGRLEATTGHLDRGRTVKIGYYDQLGRDLDLTARVRDAVAGDKGAPSNEDNALMRRFWFDGDAQFAPIGTLSGGERRRLQLLLTLIEQPNVLLLDEPTNDLDLDTLRALEEFLEDWPGIVVVVSHDRVFLDRVVTEVLALDGQGGAGLVRGGVEGWLAQRAAARAAASVKPVAAKVAARDARPRADQPGAAKLRAATFGAGAAEAAARRAGAADAGIAEPGARAARVGVARPGAGTSPSTVRRRLGAVERALADANDRGARLEAELAAAGADHGRLADLSAQLADVHAEVAAAEEQWLELAADAEALGLDV